MKIWRCKECDWVSNAEPKGSIGTAHAHAERHAKPVLLGLKEMPSWFPWLVADPERLGEIVEKIEVQVVEQKGDDPE